MKGHFWMYHIWTGTECRDACVEEPDNTEYFGTGDVIFIVECSRVYEPFPRWKGDRDSFHMPLDCLEYRPSQRKNRIHLRPKTFS